MNIADEARIIDTAFRAHSIGCTVQAPPHTFQTATHRFFALRAGPTQRIAKITGLADELDEVLTAERGESVAVRFGLAPLVLSVPRPDPKPQSLAQVFARWQRHPVQVADDRLYTLLGESIVGRTVKLQLLDLSSPNMPHVFVAGTTGSGKTNLIAQIIFSVAYLHSPAQVRMFVVDPKGVDRDGVALPELNGLPHLARPVITDMDEAVDILRWLVAEMDRRGTENDAGAVRMLLVVDELADMIARAGDVVNHLLDRLLAKGRGVGIHVIGATQKPTADLLGSVVKANFPARIVGKVNSKIDANTAAQRPGSEAERSAGRGDFVMVLGDFRRVQAFLVSKADVAGWVKAIAKMHGTAGPVRPEAPVLAANWPQSGQTARSTGPDRSGTADVLSFGPPDTAEAIAHIQRVYAEAGSYNEALRRLGWWDGDGKGYSKADGLKYIKAALSAVSVERPAGKVLRMYPKEAA